MWKLSSCFLRWAPVQLIHSKILTIRLFAKHLTYEIYIFIIVSDYIFFCEINYEFVYSVDFALQKGHLEVVKFLVENGAIGVDRALCRATMVLLWLFCFVFFLKKNRRA